MNLRAIAWDVDGTLVDSEPVHLLALKDVCHAYGVDISDLPDERFIGVHIKDVWRALAPRFGHALTLPLWEQEINAHYLRHATLVKPMPGASEAVAALARMGFVQVAVSNSNRAVVQANLSVCGFTSHMCFSITLDDVTEGKPHPAPYLLAADRLQLPPTQILAIEDSATGLRSAKSAGLLTVGCGNHASLKLAGALWTITSLVELFNLPLMAPVAAHASIEPAKIKAARHPGAASPHASPSPSS